MSNAHPDYRWHFSAIHSMHELLQLTNKLNNVSGFMEQAPGNSIWLSVHIFMCSRRTQCIGNPSRSSLNHSYFFRKANTKDISVQRVHHQPSVASCWPSLQVSSHWLAVERIGKKLRTESTRCLVLLNLTRAAAAILSCIYHKSNVE